MEKLLFFYENRNIAKDMGMMARQHIEPYTWEAYENSLIEHYYRLLEKKRTSLIIPTTNFSGNPEKC